MWIDKLDNGKFKYVERYYDHEGKQRFVSKTLTKDSPQAWKQAQKILDKKIADKLKLINKPNNITIQEVVDEWLKVMQSTVKASSISIYTERLNHVIKALDDQKLNDLTAQKFNVIFLNMLNSGLYYKTVAERFNLIKRVLEFAVNYGYLPEDNITNKMVLPKINVSDKKLDNYLEPKEAKQVFDQLKEIGHAQFASVFELQMLTGMRYGEATSLHASDIDLKAGTININRTYDRKNKLYTLPKSNRTRTIFISAETATLVRNSLIDSNRMKMLLGYQNVPLIFLTDKGSPLDIMRANEALKRMEIDKNVTTHTFRHTFITRMVENAVPTKLIAEHVGHSTTTHIETIYTHFSDKMSKDLQHAINRVKF